MGTGNVAKLPNPVGLRSVATILGGLAALAPSLRKYADRPGGECAFQDEGRLWSLNLALSQMEPNELIDLQVPDANTSTRCGGFYGLN
jgi:hypothetical protein